MANYTMKQIAAVAALAGFTGENLQIAVAVAWGESTGQTDVVNYLGCVGLWQIYEKVWKPTYNHWTTDWLKVPANNAQAAKKVHEAQGWGGWTVYTSGKYKQYMAKAASAVANRAGADIEYDPSTGMPTGVAGADGSENREIGPPSGAVNNVNKHAFKNTPTMDDVYIMGSKVKDNIRDQVISATAEFTTDQVSQISITVLDPELDFLDSGLAKPGTDARLQNQRLIVASTQLANESQNPAVTVNLRPEVVQKLKNRKGDLVMDNSSPSDFVKAECEAVGAHAFIEASPKRVSVSRDIPEAGQHYEIDQTPSSWTTFQRFADELGFIVFEENGTIYFGRPTYFTNKGKKIPLKVGFRTGPQELRCMDIPDCAKTIDSVETTIRLSLPLSRAFEARCGRTLELKGVPEFDGHYMVSSVRYNLAGDTQFLELEAQTPVDPVAHPPDTGEGMMGGGLTGVGSISDGSWPLPGGKSKYPITTAFGVSGSWAAGYHTGADFSCSTGTPVFAVYDGVIDAIGGWGSAYGTHIILKVGEQKWAYCHLSRVTVAKGAQVKSGQQIGYSGNTGNTTGPHLHLELRTSPFKYANKCLDPAKYMMKTGVTSGEDGGANAARGTGLASDFVALAQSRIGGQYVFGADRSNSALANQALMVFDCSSLVAWAMWQCGIKNFPTNTRTQTSYLQKKGMKITIEQAKRIRGALLFREKGQEHVAISLGNGKTVEAMNRQYGVTSSKVDGRQWDYAYLAPGMRYQGKL